MKNLALIFIFVFLFGFVKSQQTPVNNQYLLNKFSMSPVYAGLEDVFVASLGYRQDMVGIEGAPVTKFLNINGLIGDEVGIGLDFVNDNTNIFNYNQLNLTYAYHYNLSNTQSISMALSGGIYENHINFSDNKASFQDINDPIIEENRTVTGINYNAGFSLLYDIYDINIGLHIPRMLEITPENGEEVPYTQKRFYKTHLSYRYVMMDTYSFEPMIISRIMPNAPLNWEFALLSSFRSEYFLGFTYRSNQAMAASLGIFISDILNIGYSYEFSGNGILAESSGCHEISLNFYFGDGSSRSSMGGEVDADKVMEKNNELINKNNKLLKQHNDLLKENNKFREKSNSKKAKDGENEDGESYGGDFGSEENSNSIDEDTEMFDENYDEKMELVTGHYVVVESLRSPKNAENRKKYWIEKGYSDVVIYYEKTRLYYYISLKFEDRNEAEGVRSGLRNGDIPDAWIWDVY